MGELGQKLPWESKPMNSFCAEATAFHSERSPSGGMELYTLVAQSSISSPFCQQSIAAS